MAKQIIRSIRKGSVQWNEEDRLQMVSMLAKAGYAVQIVRKEIPSSETTYENYCSDHPHFPNGKAVHSISNIRKIYDKCSDEHSFL